MKELHQKIAGSIFVSVLLFLVMFLLHLSGQGAVYLDTGEPVQSPFEPWSAAVISALAGMVILGLAVYDMKNNTTEKDNHD